VFRTFGPKRDWRSLHNEPYNLNASPSIIRVIKSRIWGWRCK